MAAYACSMSGDRGQSDRPSGVGDVTKLSEREALGWVRANADQQLRLLRTVFIIMVLAGLTVVHQTGSARRGA